MSLVCATSIVALLSLPMGPQKQVVLFALSTLWIGGGFLALGWSRVASGRTGVWAAGSVLGGAIPSAAIAVTAGWAWLDYANAAVCLLLGLLTFLVLERRQKLLFAPGLRGVVHASAAVAAAYVPVTIVWLVMRV